MKKLFFIIFLVINFVSIGKLLAQVPTINSFNPSSGPVGTLVTINGTNFSAIAANNVVYFGAVKATVSAATTSLLTVKAPLGATYQNVTVTTNGLTGYSNKPFIETFTGRDTSITVHSFAQKVNYGSLHARQVLVGDIDGDGKLDLIECTSAISIFRNTSSNGTLSFAPKIDYPVGRDVRLSDIDGDGRLDLIADNGSQLLVFRNISTIGNILFAPGIVIDTAAKSIGVVFNSLTGTAIGDLDLDGKPDIVVANSGNRSISILQNTSTVGNISFKKNIDLSIGDDPSMVFISDLDGDDKLDLAVRSGPYSPLIIFKNTSNNGAITFASKIYFPNSQSSLRQLAAIGDIDGDGKPDLVTLQNYPSGFISIFRNTSVKDSISFIIGPTLVADNTPDLASLADLDGDGKIDIVADNPYPSSPNAPLYVSVYKNISVVGLISIKPKTDFITGGITGPVIADLNGTGRPDIICGAEEGVAVLRNEIGSVVQTLATMQNAIKYDSHQLTAAEPIQLGTGTYEYTHNDFRLSTVNDSLNFTRFYNSLNDTTSGPLGYAWSHSYNYHLNIQTNPASHADVLWSLQYPDGHLSAFVPLNNSTGGSTALYIGTQDSLKKDSAGTFTLFTRDNHQYHFTSSGVLDHVADLNGNTTQFNYSGGNLTSVVGQGGRTLKLTYTGNNITSVSDPLNRSCSFSYDTNNNLKAATDANGNVTSFSYDGKHRMLTATNALGNIIVSNAYDTTGRVINQLDAYNQATTISYNSPSTGDATVTNPDNSQFIVHHDSAFRKTYIKDELGFTKTYTYDAYSNENSFTDENNQIETRQFDKFGNLLSRAQPGGINTTITYNAFNSPLQLTDPNGNVTTFTYDGSNNLLSKHLPDNTYQYFTYYPNGLRNTFKDGRGNVTTYTYSPNGDLLSVAAPNGTKSYSYDAAGRRISITDENNNTSKYTYDKNDNILTITDPLNHVTSFTYDAINNLTSVTDKNGFTTSFTYDKKGRMVSKTNANGGITKNTYDVRDNLVGVTDPNNNTISYAYDKKNRKTGSTNSLGTTQTQYDGVGNTTQIIDGTNKTTSFTYTPVYKTKTISDGLNNTTTYGYDKNGNQLTITDPLNKTTTYSYNAMDRLTSVVDAANNTTKITYDENGNKKSVSDPNGHVQSYTYDAANRLITYLDAGGNTTGYTYDAVGNNTAINKPTGSITKTFDVMNRLISSSNSTGENYGFTYDNNNNIITTTCSAGTTNMAYDKLNELTQYTDPFNKKVLFGYDAAGNKQSITYPGNKAVSYTYDNANNLKKVTDWLNNSFTYNYDAAGRVTQLLYPNSIQCNYTFDGAGRLTSIKNQKTGSPAITGSVYTLDAAGNRLTEQKSGQLPSNLIPVSGKYTYGNDDRLLSDSVWTYLSDNSGNRTSATKGKAKVSFTFSTDDRLGQMVDTLGRISAFIYDAQGHRLSSSVGSNNNRFVVDPSNNLSQILQITDGTGAIKSQYIYGNGLLERVDSLGNTLYYHYDGQHNTAALTDASAVVTDTYTYDPFGTLLFHKGTTNQPFAFLGEFGVEQQSSSLYYVRARYYDAANGRFLSKDAYPYSSINPQTIDRYVYSTNNPLTRFDYSGLYQSQDYYQSSLHPMFNLGINHTDYSLTEVEGNVLNAMKGIYDKLSDNPIFPLVSPFLPSWLSKTLDFAGLSNDVLNVADDYKNYSGPILDNDIRLIHDEFAVLLDLVAPKWLGVAFSETDYFAPKAGRLITDSFNFSIKP